MNKDNQRLNLILKWIFRIISALGLVTIGILLVVLYETIGDDGISSDTFSLLLGAIIAGLSYTGAKIHGDIKEDKENGATHEN